MKSTQIFLPPKPDVTRQQISNALSVVQDVGSFICTLRVNDADEGGKPGGASDGGASDGGALLAAEQTFIRACDTLDRILADPSRWDTSYTDQLEAIATLALAKQAAPHARLKPQINAMDDGTFAVTYGTSTENLIYGLGKTIEEALTDFDRQFNVAAAEVRKVVAAPPAPVWDAPEVPPKKRKKKNT